MSAAHRNARHIALPQIGEDGQKSIANSRALIIGMGGLGCPAATYLACAGIGELLLNDFDSIDATNLGRQVLYSEIDIGKLKAAVAAERLSALNPAVNIEAIESRLSTEELRQLISSVDIVLDASDNFSTRFNVNDACVKSETCLISGAAIRLEGQLAVFGPNYAESACYACLYTEADESLDNCAGNGVLAAVPGVIGTMMAVEALKILAGNKPATGSLRLYDATANQFTQVKINKRQDCSVCFD